MSFKNHLVYVKNTETGVDQSLTPSGLKSVLANPKLNKKIHIKGFADEKGRLIEQTEQQANDMYRPLIVDKEAPIKPIEELKPNQDQGEENKNEME